MSLTAGADASPHGATVRPRATRAVLRLARFQQLRCAEDPATPLPGAPLFSRVAADSRAAGTDPASREAFVFLWYQLHRDEATAFEAFDGADAALPWMRGAAECWTAVLAPFRHYGEINHLGAPGTVFDPLEEPPADEAPVAVVTSAGWDPGPGFEMQRVLDFAAGVVAVRMSMSGVDGLHAQHSFFFPGVLKDDPITLTMWRSQAAMHRFAYGGGSHRHQMDKHRAGSPLSDRTSFTRFRVVRSAGRWHAGEPEGWGR